MNTGHQDNISYAPASNSTVSLETIIALCKRRGFIYPTAEIYGGLNGVYDTGPLGTLLKQNIRAAWSQSLKKAQPNILFIEGATLGPASIWQGSGHTQSFQDPMVDCLTCKKRFRADDPDFDITKACPHCGQKSWTDIRQFNLMFQTNIGASTQTGSTAYLRPETAQSIFVNFKNILSTNRVKIPFGIAQIGKAFRNEITPKQFLFRMREFEQMELEWFCKPAKATYFFEFWLQQRLTFYKTLGLKSDHIRVRAHTIDELSHYAHQTSDIEYKFPFGWKELEGIAHRADFDLTQHSKHAGKDLAVYDEETKTSYMPYVIESSVGTDRLFLTLLCDAYHIEKLDDESRVVLKLSPQIAPFKAAIFPLTKKQIAHAHTIYQNLICAGLSVQFDQSGSIGKRYRRQDEIGTPFCITVDFDSETNQSVTIRNRDTMTQERISIDQIIPFLQRHVQQTC